MRARISYLFAALVLVVSCSKDKYQTKPTVRIISVPDVVPVDGSFTAKLEFTQKAGKLSGGTFIAIRNRLNQRPLTVGGGSTDTLQYDIPEFPNQNKGEFDLNLDYSYLHQSDDENDTIVFRLAVIDANNLKSDTVVTSKIVVLHP